MTLHWRNLWSDTAPGAAWEHNRYRHYTRLHWAIWWVRATLDWWWHSRSVAVHLARLDAGYREEDRYDRINSHRDQLMRNPDPAIRAAADSLAITEWEHDFAEISAKMPHWDGAIGWDPKARVYRPVPVSWFPPIPGRDK